MAPTIEAGSTVIYKPVAASQIKLGDIIIFAEPGHAAVNVARRVYAHGIDVGGKYFITKGDANGAPDPWHVPAAGTLGKALRSVPAAYHFAVGHLRRHLRACRN